MIAPQERSAPALVAEPWAVRRVTVLEARTVRHQVLRPGEPFSALMYEGDAASDSAHFASFEGVRMVAVASAVRRPPPGSLDARSWCLCGVATLGGVRGRGHGRQLVSAVIDHAVCHGGRLVWCSARVGAVRFYQRCGFRPDPGTPGGPEDRHLQMSRLLACSWYSSGRQPSEERSGTVVTRRRSHG